jgi:hypothetical protein
MSFFAAIRGWFDAKPNLDERDRLVAENQELGRLSDQIRLKRMDLRKRIDEINTAKFKADMAARAREGK